MFLCCPAGSGRRRRKCGNHGTSQQHSGQSIFGRGSSQPGLTQAGLQRVVSCPRPDHTGWWWVQRDGASLQLATRVSQELGERPPPYTPHTPPGGLQSTARPCEPLRQATGDAGHSPPRMKRSRYADSPARRRHSHAASYPAGSTGSRMEAHQQRLLTKLGVDGALARTHLRLHTVLPASRWPTSSQRC